ncbi:MULTISPECIES: hypothetical protein [Bradyrhizobium]|uniref:hypothetical protein n=1 Tax=Bradyrhizobium TaxID=374 RepID=UPI00211F2D75|nr:MULTISPECIES: hypothetical protein [Bradyrhizobium]
MKTEARGARVYVDDICHDMPDIITYSAGDIAAKPHSRERLDLATKRQFGGDVSFRFPSAIFLP